MEYTSLTEEYLENGSIWVTDNKKVSFENDRSFMEWMESELKESRRLHAEACAVADGLAEQLEWERGKGGTFCG